MGMAPRLFLHMPIPSLLDVLDAYDILSGIVDEGSNGEYIPIAL